MSHRPDNKDCPQSWSNTLRGAVSDCTCPPTGANRPKEIWKRVNDQNWPYSFLAPECRELMKQLEQVKANVTGLTERLGWTQDELQTRDKELEQVKRERDQAIEALKQESKE